jgi:putative Holliday junction resolvase
MSALPSAGRLLALDWGEVRIGVALSDETPDAGDADDHPGAAGGQAVSHAAAARAGGRARPGRPGGGPALTGEGEEGGSAAAARELANDVARRSGLPVALWDERMSTARALAAIREQGGRTKGRKEDVDALAAARSCSSTTSTPPDGPHMRRLAPLALLLVIACGSNTVPERVSVRPAAASRRSPTR